MSVKCDYCGKKPQNGNQVSHSNRKSPKFFQPNLQTVRVRNKGGNRKKVRVCTQCIRSGRTLAAF